MISVTMGLTDNHELNSTHIAVRAAVSTGMTELMSNYACSTHQLRLFRFVSKVGQIGTHWDKSGTLEDYFPVHTGSLSQNVLKIIFKSPRFVPVGANLTLFGHKSEKPELMGRTGVVRHQLSHPSRNPSSHGDVSSVQFMIVS